MGLSNLPPGVTDQMIEEQAEPPFITERMREAEEDQERIERMKLIPADIRNINEIEKRSRISWRIKVYNMAKHEYGYDFQTSLMITDAICGKNEKSIAADILVDTAKGKYQELGIAPSPERVQELLGEWAKRQELRMYDGLTTEQVEG